MHLCQNSLPIPALYSENHHHSPRFTTSRSTFTHAPLVPAGIFTQVLQHSQQARHFLLQQWLCFSIWLCWRLSTAILSVCIEGIDFEEDKHLGRPLPQARSLHGLQTKRVCSPIASGREMLLLGRRVQENFRFEVLNTYTQMSHISGS